MSKRKTGQRDVTRRMTRPVLPDADDGAAQAYKLMHGTLLQMVGSRCTALH